MVTKRFLFFLLPGDSVQHAPVTTQKKTKDILNPPLRRIERLCNNPGAYTTGNTNIVPLTLQPKAMAEPIVTRISE